MNFDLAQSIDDLDQRDVFDPELNHFSQLHPDLNSFHKSEYYDITEFNSINSYSLKDLSLVHINIRSLYHKVDHLFALLN